MKTLKTIALPTSLLIAGLFTLGAAGTAQAEVSINCSVPNAVKCTLSSPKGVRRAWVYNAPFNVYVVDETHMNCPRSVEISYDPVSGGNAYQVGGEECSGVRGRLSIQAQGAGDAPQRLRSQ